MSPTMANRSAKTTCTCTACPTPSPPTCKSMCPGSPGYPPRCTRAPPFPPPAAPGVQKPVPWTTWLPPAMRARTGLATGCLQRDLGQRQISHDNYFHSVLGLMDVQTSAYDPALDMFARCKARGEKE